MKYAQDMQMFADTLPSRVQRAATVYADGQGDVLGPIADQYNSIHQDYGTTSHASWGGYYVPEVGQDDVGGDIASYAELTKALPGNRTLSLAGRTSGSVSRVARVTFDRRRTGMGATELADPRAFGSSNGVGGLGAAPAAQPWYENPVYLGVGSVAIIGAVWFLTRK